MVNKNGLQTLIETRMYLIIDVHGLDLPFDDVCKYLIEDDIIIDDERMLREAYDFVNDQSGINYMKSPVTQDVLKIINDNTSNDGWQNKTPMETRDEVEQFLYLQGQVTEKEAQRISKAVHELLLDLTDTHDTYK